ncbi:MAG: ABC transporter ATP-binding protein [Agathobacter sp.]
MEIRLKNICKGFGKQFSIENLNMTISSGEFATFLGPSGCGKTTILRMIAGLEYPDSGEIWYDDTCVFSSKDKIHVAPEKRNLGFVFQDFALWPHMTVYENVAFPLRARKEKEGIDEKVMGALKAVRLEELAQRYPEQLSGGQQQRVAFARAIVGQPSCILFDEPLSALDAILRDEMRTEIKRLTESLGVTSVFVTHDQTEAMSMSDKIFVLNKGQVHQEGSPEEIYNNPKTKFVANFIGKSNWIDKNIMVRPENMSLTEIPNSVCYEADIVQQQFLGNTYEIQLDMNGNRWVVQSPKRQEKQSLHIYINKECLKSFQAIA